MKNIQTIVQMILLVMVLTISLIPASPAFAAYVNPPQIRYSKLTETGWTYGSGGSYYWHPPAQQAEKPHFHLSGSRNQNSGIETIKNLSYTNKDGVGNFTVPFNVNSGYQQITKNIEYKNAYNIKIDDLNKNLIRN